MAFIFDFWEFMSQLFLELQGRNLEIFLISPQSINLTYIGIMLDILDFLTGYISAVWKQ